MILMKNLILILIFAAVGLNTMASNPLLIILKKCVRVCMEIIKL